jgi:hypothetical protein
VLLGKLGKIDRLPRRKLSLDRMEAIQNAVELGFWNHGCGRYATRYFTISSRVEAGPSG